MPKINNDFIIEREDDLRQYNQVEVEELNNTDRITWYEIAYDLNNKQRHAIRDTSESEE